MRKVPVVMRIILFVLVVLFFFNSSFACSCIGRRTVKEEIEHSDAVVFGTILSTYLLTLTDSSMLKMFPNDSTITKSILSQHTIAGYVLLVHEAYKGKITCDTITVFTGIGGGDCGVKFEVGKKYVIYGKCETYFGQINNDFKFPKANNTFWTNICLRTTVDYREEIREIKKFAKKVSFKSQ